MVILALGIQMPLKLRQRPPDTVLQHLFDKDRPGQTALQQMRDTPVHLAKSRVAQDQSIFGVENGNPFGQGLKRTKHLGRLHIFCVMIHLVPSST
jgi:hypothetical protein